MTTRTLLITVPGSDDPELCGECPFLARYRVPQPTNTMCIMPLPGWDSKDVERGRHKACLDAERAAKADRSRLREVHEHLMAHGLPALDRLDAEAGKKPPAA